MKKKYISLVLSVILGMSILSGCASSSNDNDTSSNKEVVEENSTESKTEYPLTIEAFDSEGKTYEQTFEEAPTKIITNNQSSTELLLDLGLKDYIVGTGDLDNDILDRLKDDYDSIPAIAEKGDVAKEVVIGYDPDIVIGRAASFTDQTYGTIPSLNDMGINTYVQLASKMNTTQSLENIITDVRNIGKIFDIQEKANKYADDLQARLDNIVDKAKNIDSEKMKVMYMVQYEDGKFGAYGANASLQTEMLKTINAENVVEKGGTLSLENLISLNPDVIIYVKANSNKAIDEVAIESLLNNEVIQTVPAIKNKKVMEVEYTELVGYGFRTFDCLEKIASELYPDIFK